MQLKTIRSFDGTRIAYQVGGEGEKWLVVANGYGGTFCAWDDLFARLGREYRLLIWDYRGLHRSAIPEDRNLLRIEDHCRDLELIRQAEGIDKLIMAGWSVGVQVALEVYRRRPGDVTALLLINGAHGRVIKRSLGGHWITGAMIPPGLTSLRRATPLLEPTLLRLLQRLATTPLAPKLLRATGVFRADSPSLRESVVRILGLDYDVYFQMALLADEHDTEDLLPHVQVPVLVIVGAQDFITPVPLGQHIASALPQGQLEIVAGATHYGLMEQPDHYAKAITSFLDRA